MSNTSQPLRSAQEQFGRTAAAYGASSTHTNDESLLSLDSFVRDGHFETAVDVGTGPGFTAFAIAPHADRVVATDITPQMLDQVRMLRHTHNAGQTEVALAAAEALPFMDASVDLVTCRTAAHHFKDLPAWLAEVHRVLKPKGLLVAADTVSPEDQPTAQWMHRIELRRDPSHVKNLAPSEWRAAAERAGLQVTDSVLSKVYLECEDWARRAGMGPGEIAAIREELLNGPPAAKEAFGIRLDEAGALRFHWNVLALRCMKAS